MSHTTKPSNRFALLADNEIDLIDDNPETQQVLQTQKDSQTLTESKNSKRKKNHNPRSPSQDKLFDDDKFADAEGWEEESYSGISIDHEDSKAALPEILR
jgi:hypothetical protein